VKTVSFRNLKKTVKIANPVLWFKSLWHRLWVWLGKRDRGLSHTVCIVSGWVQDTTYLLGLGLNADYMTSRFES